MAKTASKDTAATPEGADSTPLPENYEAALAELELIDEYELDDAQLPRPKLCTQITRYPPGAAS